MCIVPKIQDKRCLLHCLSITHGYLHIIYFTHLLLPFTYLFSNIFSFFLEGLKEDIIPINDQFKSLIFV